MWMRKIRDAHRRRHSQRPASRRARPVELDRLDLLDRRILPAVSATFSAAQGVLTVVGDAKDNTIVVSRDAAGSILVNGGAVSVRGGRATVANTRLIQLFGLGGYTWAHLVHTSMINALASVPFVIWGLEALPLARA